MSRASGGEQPEIETGCKWSWTDAAGWNLEKETAEQVGGVRQGLSEPK